MTAPVCRWTVSVGDPTRLGLLVRRIAPDGAEALEAGRVFLDGRRVQDADAEVRRGQLLEVYAARASTEGVVVLAARAGIVAAHKPAGIATEPERRGAASARARVAALLGEPESRVHAASRLDLGVSGIVLFALTAEARSELAHARQQHRLSRRYVAIGAGRLQATHGTWDEPVAERGRLPESGKRASVATRAAETRFAAVATLESVRAHGVWPAARRTEPVRAFALLALEPVTGRTHQLRIHAASAGCPLLGDARYGGPERLVFADGSVEALSRVALHCARVRLEPDPSAPRRSPFALGGWQARAPAPATLVAQWTSMGGVADDWSRAEDDALVSS